MVPQGSVSPGAVPQRAVRPLVIVGAGGHGREAWDVVEAVNAERPCWEPLGFVTDGGEDSEPLRRRGLEVLGPIRHLATLDADYVVAIGDSRARRRVCDGLAARGRPATLVHPSADVATSATLAPGSIVAAGAVIGPGVRAGRHVHVNVNAVLETDAVLEDFVTVSPGCRLGAGAGLGEAVFLGAGSKVLPGLGLGALAVVGAGALVADDVGAECIVVGRPAQVVNRSRPV